MTDIVYKTQEEWNEKHLSIMEKTANWVKVTVWGVLHPMEVDHRISIIEIVLGNGEIMKKILKPGEHPSAEFETDQTVVELREFCNKHWRWKNKISITN